MYDRRGNPIPAGARDEIVYLRAKVAFAAERCRGLEQQKANCEALIEKIQRVIDHAFPGTRWSEFDVLDQAVATLERERDEARKSSMTWGDLPEGVRQLCSNLKPPVQPHEWDNMNITEQRDWAINQLDISERFLNVERKNHQVSINAWKEDEQRAETAESRLREREEQIASLAKLISSEVDHLKGWHPEHCKAEDGVGGCSQEWLKSAERALAALRKE